MSNKYEDMFKDSSDPILYNNKKLKVNNFKNVMASNLLFGNNKLDMHTKFNRYGFIDVVNTIPASREYLFFTKPDLNIFTGKNYSDLDLNSDLKNFPLFVDAFHRHKKTLTQLQSSVNGPDNTSNPFMYLLSNKVTSKLELPSINNETKESTSNIYGTNIQYRSHSLKSDNGYDFSLSFTDNSYLDLYTLFKIYDEFIRLARLGEVYPIEEHILNKILWDQFSIYKFLIEDDGETIAYFAKLTGVFISGVPRDIFSDVEASGYKYNVQFHTQFVEDMNPVILQEFNTISPATNKTNSKKSFSPTYKDGVVNNTWVRYPVVKKVYASESKKVNRKPGFEYDYVLKWIE